MLRLGYANGDRLAYWWLDSYVGFSSKQKPWVKAEIDRFFDWHRRTQLPDYARVLARAQQRLQQPANAAEIQKDFVLMQQRFERMLDFALPSLATLALSLSPGQIDNIERKFAANNEKYRKEHLQGSLQERQQARFDKVMKHAEYWFGDFSRAQKEQIRAASDARPMDYALGLAERLQRQQALIALLRKIQAERPPRSEVEGMLRNYAKRALQNFTYADHKAFFDASRAGMAEMAARIVNLATPAQKVHATRQLQKLIDDGYALAGVQAPEQLSMQSD